MSHTIVRPEDRPSLRSGYSGGIAREFFLPLVVGEALARVDLRSWPRDASFYCRYEGALRAAPVWLERWRSYFRTHPSEGTSDPQQQEFRGSLAVAHEYERRLELSDERMRHTELEQDLERASRSRELMKALLEEDDLGLEILFEVAEHKGLKISALALHLGRDLDDLAPVVAGLVGSEALESSGNKFHLTDLGARIYERLREASRGYVDERDVARTAHESSV